MPLPLITVIIPCHNPRPAVIARTMSALISQTLDPERWEAIVVDNRSSPPLTTESWGVPLPRLRLVREETLGLTQARLAGITAAQGMIIVFVDDDNLLANDYLERTAEFLARHPEVGVLGGRITGEFATPPADWARPHLGSLALRDLGQARLISEHPPGLAPKHYDFFAPFGAGMVVRREIAQSYLNWARSTPALADRTGQHLGGCGDCEIVVRALKEGFQCGYDPQLNLTHLIPIERTRFAYLGRLAWQGQRSWAQFSVRHGFAKPISRTGVHLRQLKALITCRIWTRTGCISWIARCGYFEGQIRPNYPNAPESVSE